MGLFRRGGKDKQEQEPDSYQSWQLQSFDAPPEFEAPADEEKPKRQVSINPPWAKIATGLLVLLLVGGVVGVLLSPLANPLWSMLGRLPTSSFKLLPYDTPLYMRLTFTAPQLRNLEALKAKFTALPEFKDTWTRFERAAMFDPAGDLKWDADVMSWLGEEVVIAVPPRRGNTTGSGVLIAAETRDTVKSEIALRRWRDFQEKRGRKLAVKQYRSLVYFTDNADVNIVSFDNFVVYASTELLLKQTIDQVSVPGLKALSDNPTHTEVLKALPSDRIGEIYIYPGQALPPQPTPGPSTSGASATGTSSSATTTATAVVLGTSTPTPLPLVTPTPIPPPTPQVIRGVGAALKVEADGIALETVIIYDLSRTLPDVQAAVKVGPVAAKAANVAPEKTALFVVTHDLRQIGRALPTILAGNAAFSDLYGDVQQFLGLNLDDDILYWMSGEVAIAVVEDSDGLAGNKGEQFGLMVLFEPASRPQAEGTMGKLRDKLVKAGFKFEKRTLNGTQFEVLNGPAGVPSAGFGFVNSFLVIGTSPGVLGQASTGRVPSLAGVSAYQTALKAAPADRLAFLYGDPARLATMAKQTKGLGERTKSPGFFDVLATLGTIAKPAKSMVGWMQTLSNGNQHRSRIFIQIA